tara:strand:- start:153 stop:422 length:270 start_codon:yes stop_codon:yes gene_type:complete
MDEEIILPENKMYIVMTPIGEDQFNIICVDKMKEPINELYYMMRGLCEMSVKHQEDLIEIGKDVVLQASFNKLKDSVKSNVIPFKPRRK